MNEALLLCALNRRGEPASAGDLADDAVGLAQSAGWPERTWRGKALTQTTSRLLQSMAGRGVVLRGAPRREGGRDVPTYALVSYDRTAAMPDRPDPEGTDHPLHGTTDRQRFVLFDVHDSMLQAMARQRQELNALVERHTRELAALSERNRRDLLAVGLMGVP